VPERKPHHTAPLLAFTHCSTALPHYKNSSTQQNGKELIFCLDNDRNNRETQRLIQQACDRQYAAGNRIYTNKPAKIKTDYNDVLKEQGASAVNYTIDHSIEYYPIISPELPRSSRLENSKNIEKYLFYDANKINFIDRGSGYEKSAQTDIKSQKINKNKSYTIEQEL